MENDGLELLSKMLLLSTESRISAATAASHPFLEDESSHRQSYCCNRIHQLMQLECAPISDRQHVRVDEWASVVDWLMEVALVFDLSDEYVFQAMGYFDEVFQRSTVSDCVKKGL